MAESNPIIDWYGPDGRWQSKEARLVFQSAYRIAIQQMGLAATDAILHNVVAATAAEMRDRHLPLVRVRDRQDQVIAAMQRRAERNPVRDLLWRRPWRARHRPRWSHPVEVWDWLRKAHDCANPAVGCSCSGGFRFPDV